MKTIIKNTMSIVCMLAVAQAVAGEKSKTSTAPTQSKTRRVVEKTVPVRITAPKTDKEESSVPTVRSTPQIERKQSSVPSTGSAEVQAVTPRITPTIQRGKGSGTSGAPSLPSHLQERKDQTRTGGLTSTPEGTKTAPSTTVVPGALDTDRTPSRVQLKESFGEPIVPDVVPVNVGTPAEMALEQQWAKEQIRVGAGVREMTETERVKAAMGLQQVLDVMNSFAGRGELLGRLEGGSSAVDDIKSRLQGDSDDALTMPEQNLPDFPSLTGGGTEDDASDEGMDLHVGGVPGAGGQDDGGGSGSSGLTTGSEHSHIPASRNRSAIASCGGSTTVQTTMGNHPNGSGYTTTTYRNNSGSTSIQVLKTAGGSTTRVIITHKDNNGNTTAQFSYSTDKDGKTEVEPELAPITDGDEGEATTGGGQDKVNRPEEEQHYRVMTMSLEEAIAGLQGRVVDSNVIMPNPDDEGGGQEEGGGISGVPDQHGGIEQPDDELGGSEDMDGPSSKFVDRLDRDRPQGEPEPIDPIGPGEDQR